MPEMYQKDPLPGVCTGGEGCMYDLVLNNNVRELGKMGILDPDKPLNEIDCPKCDASIVCVRGLERNKLGRYRRKKRVLSIPTPSKYM